VTPEPDTAAAPHPDVSISVAPVPVHAGEEDSALRKALEAQRRAEELQDPHRALEHHIASLPISDHKRHFLRQHPELLNPQVAPLATESYRQALAAGVPDDTPAMNDEILSRVRAEIERRTAAHIAQAAQQQPMQAAPAQPQQRSIQMTAPVSRQTPSASTGKQSSNNNILSAEEREIARNSFSNTNMTNTEKELLYWRNRERYRQQRASGQYRDQFSE
jgi:hypothetical protein